MIRSRISRAQAYRIERYLLYTLQHVLVPECDGVTVWFLFLISAVLAAAQYSAPAGTRPALRRPGAASILPGGRIIAPLGIQYITGPGPFGLARSPGGGDSGP